MKRKVLYILIFFAIFYVGEVTLSYSFKNSDQVNFNSSELVPISQSLDNFYSSNYQTIVIDNYISEFITKWGIKGASVAISKEGRLVYAMATTGFDFTLTIDSRSMSSTPVLPTKACRISLTKMAAFSFLESDGSSARAMA